MKFLYAFSFSICCALLAQAQSAGVQLLPLSNQPILNHYADMPQAENAPPDSINLPFVEDFSHPGPFPDPNLWLDKKVFVNNTMSFNPPSVGVATFDAINTNGKPYGQQGEYGVADTLTSNYINLRDYFNNDGTKRPLVVADSVYLSFFLQPKGLCYEPLERDSMVLEFRDNAGNWKFIRSFKGFRNYIPADSFPPFQMYFVPITEGVYFYGKFQFRFRSYGQLDGANELWHLDYVKIAPNRRMANRALDDLAFVQAPRSILRRYSAMPWRHAVTNLGTEVEDVFNARFFNHFAAVRNPTLTNVKVSSSTGVTAVNNFTVLDGVNIPPSLFFQSTNKTMPSTLRGQLGTIPTTATNFTINTEYSLNIEGQEGKDTAKAALRNDRVVSQTPFQNYFAYDDGTAELMYAATGFNQQTAVQFRTNVADTLRGVQFSFPYVRIKYLYRDAKMNIQIWKDSLNTVPIYEQKNVSPFSVDAKVDSLQGITTYRLESKTAGRDTFIVLPANTTFFVGYQNIDNRIPIGLDRNSFDKGKYAFTRLNNRWDTIPIYPLGALMIRAVVGRPVQSTSSLAVRDMASEALNLYPNPASDYLTVENTDGLDLSQAVVQVYNLLGQLQKQRSLSAQGHVSVSDLQNGTYLLIIKDLRTQLVYRKKFVVAR
jgi:hypothetical protein